MWQSVRIIQRISRHAGGPVADIPTFLCPGILRIVSTTRIPPCKHQPKPAGRTSQRRFISSAASDNSPGKIQTSGIAGLNKLPQQCAGCGAFSQTVDQQGPGYFTLTRGSVKNYLSRTSGQRLSEEDRIVKKALEAAGPAGAGFKLGDFSSPGTV